MMRREHGFSLVELMVAMTVTLVVSGAIYGLLTAGGNAFRREPEVADRQQNIRLAMDLVARDVYSAGAALPTFSQVFTRTDAAVPAGGCTGANGLNGCGVAGSLGAPAAAVRALGGDGNDPSTNSDVLELVTVDERCPTQTVCTTTVAGGTAGTFVVREGIPSNFTLPGLALLTDNSVFAIQTAAAVGTAQACPAGGVAARNGTFALGAALAPWTAALPLANTPPVVFLYSGRVIRYRIANSTDPLDNGPVLWRSVSGRYALDGTAPVEPGNAGFAGGQPWEIVARGIEDLQIEYMAGDLVWRNRPPVSVANDWTTLVRRVRITLSARSTVANLQGQTTAAAGGAGGNAVRGQLVTVVAPRDAFNELEIGSQIR